MNNDALKKELEAAYKSLERADNRIKSMSRQLNEYEKVERVIIAAGLLNADKFNEARSLVAKFDDTGQ